MGRRDGGEREERMARLSKRVMENLRYRYNMEEIGRETFVADQAVAEEQLRELLGWRKQEGQKVRIQEGGTEEGKKWIKGLPSRNKKGADRKEGTHKERTDEEKEREMQENNSWQGWQDWSEWEEEQKKTEAEQLKGEGKWSKKEEKACPTRGKKRERSAEI